MPKEKLLINPDTGQEYIDVPPRIAAGYLGVSKEFIYAGMKSGQLPIGSAVQGERGKWSFNIPCQRLKAYANGIDVQVFAEILSNMKMVNKQ